MDKKAMKVWERDFGDEQRANDQYGAEIRKESYGQTGSRFGWDLDHIKPVSLGGTDRLDNLRPLHMKNNKAKGASLGGNWS